jgi:phenylpropionate dioxygenase-like ring-hydroxylating dioxygenase large terminal subunit
VRLFPRLPNEWYIAALANEVGGRPLARTVLGERMVLFRDSDGRPAALQDRCLHRNMALSAGRLADGCLECPYHGWRYNAEGRCVAIPSLDDDARMPALRPLRTYPAMERDGYVWVWPGERRPAHPPRSFAHLGEPGWTSFRMRTHFQASAFACLENFLDCPHTVFVHRGWFRTAVPRTLGARLRRFPDRVEVDFVDERPARSVVSSLFFSAGASMRHTDCFLMPATSRVDYAFAAGRHFIITSECTPVGEHETDVYTVITFRYGRIGPLVRLTLEPVCRRIIQQDVRVLERQTAQLGRFSGPRFASVETDLFGPHIQRLWARAEDGRSRGAVEDDMADLAEDIAIRF